MRIKKAVAVLAGVLLFLTACSDDDDEASQPSRTTTTAPNDSTIASTTTAPPPNPPAPGEPGTAVIVFDDGDTETSDVTCQLEPLGEFSVQAESDVELLPFFGLLMFTDPDRSPEAVWETEDERWAAGAPTGTDLVVTIDESILTGTTVFRSPTGQERAGAFTIACAP